MGSFLGFKKMFCGTPRPPRRPPKWRPAWISKNQFSNAKLASMLRVSWQILGDPCPIQDRFLRPNLAPCWPHVSRQHETMLDGQHGLMLKANMGSCWCLESKSLCPGNILVRPGNSSVPGEQFCVPREHFCAPGEQFCVPGEHSV